MISGGLNNENNLLHQLEDEKISEQSLKNAKHAFFASYTLHKLDLRRIIAISFLKRGYETTAILDEMKKQQDLSLIVALVEQFKAYKNNGDSLCLILKTLAHFPEITEKMPEELLEAILEKLKAFKMLDSRAHNLLLTAVQENNLKLTKLLIYAGTNPFQTDRLSITLLPEKPKSLLDHAEEHHHKKYGAEKSNDAMRFLKFFYDLQDFINLLHRSLLKFEPRKAGFFVKRSPYAISSKEFETIKDLLGALRKIVTLPIIENHSSANKKDYLCEIRAKIAHHIAAYTQEWSHQSVCYVKLSELLKIPTTMKFSDINEKWIATLIDEHSVFIAASKTRRRLESIACGNTAKMAKTMPFTFNL